MLILQPGDIAKLDRERDVWRRAPHYDVRVGRGDDFAGDCWVNQRGDRRYTVVGFDLNAPGNEAVRDNFGPI